MNETATSIESRFEGHEIIEAGMAQIPNMLIEYYTRLGLSDGHYTLLSHILYRKWTKAAPFPTVTGIRMSANEDTRRRHVRDLRRKGLLFTTRLYWTKADSEKNEMAVPGRVRSNLWFLGSLFHNLVRIDKWIEAGKPEADFQIEIPLVTVRMFLEGKFHDTPEEVVQLINEQTKNGTVLKAVLLPNENKETKKSTTRNSSTRKTSTRKSHTLKEESDSNKNQKPNKKNKGASPARCPLSVKVYQEVANRYPDKATWETITQAVGEEESRLAFWKEVITAWIGCGYNKINITGMLDCFKRGELPTTKKNGKDSHSYGRTKTPGSINRNGPAHPPAAATGLGEWTEDEKRQLGFS